MHGHENRRWRGSRRPAAKKLHGHLAAALLDDDCKGMGDDAITNLLERLSSRSVDAAWQEFLVQYSRLIRHVIRRHGLEGEPAADCYVHVCAALSDNAFRRLRSFRPDGPARFTTWLMAVVSNLCVDWRRGEHRRMRPFHGVARLPDLEQQVYRCIYEQRMSRRQCMQALASRFPELTEALIAEINARLFALLTPQQRWQLAAQAPVSLPTTADDSSGDHAPEWQIPQPGPGPDELAEQRQEEQQLHEALSQLPAEQRLLLRLRYEQNLTLAEIARLTQQPDPFRVNRKIMAALESLAELLGKRQRGPMRTRTWRAADMNPDHLTQMLTANVRNDAQRTPACPDDHDIAGYVDGGLDELPRQRVEGHLADCAFCLRLVGLLSRARTDEASAEGVRPQREILESAVVRQISHARLRLAPTWAAAAVLILAIPMLMQLSRTADRGPEGQTRPDSHLTRNAPGVVSLQVLSPSPGETVDSRKLTFRWSEVTGTPFYDVRVVTDAGDIVVEQRVEGTTWQPPPRLDLHGGAEYFVHIDAYPSGDKSVSSDHVPFRISD